MADDAFKVVYRHRSGTSHTVDGLLSAWEAGVIRDALSIKEALDAGEDLRRLELRDGSGLPWPALIAEAQCSTAVASLPFAGVVQQLQCCVDRTRQEAEKHGERNGRAFTLLLIAAACQHKEAALLLLAAAPIMAVRLDRRGRTVLHAVAELGWADVVGPLLMAASEAATARDYSGATPLVAAHAGQQIEAARALMSTTLSSPSASTLLGSMMLESVERNDERELAALMWAAAASGADGGGASLLDDVLSDAGPSLLGAALYRRGVRTTRLLLEAAPWLATQRDSEGQTALHWVASAWPSVASDQRFMQPVFQMVEALLAVPGTATAQDSQGRTALFLALGAAAEAEEYTEAIPNFLNILAAAAPAAVALPAATGETPVHLAALARKEDLQALLDAAPEQVAATLSPAAGLPTPLQMAFEQRRWDAVVFLLEAVMHAGDSNSAAAAWRLLLEAAHGLAALAQLDYDGRTLLHAAARRPTAAVLRLLLSEQVGDVMVPDGSGRLPLHIAALYSSAEAIRLLLAAAPAAAAVRDEYGALPLHHAAGSADAEAVQLLLEAAPQAATAGNQGGWLPLHLAAPFGVFEAVQLLLEAAPATADSKTKAGETALTLALSNLRSDAAALLFRHVNAQEGLKEMKARAPSSMHHLYAELVTARLPLTATEWALVPSPCPKLGRALPPALHHSTEQARQLVRRLPAADAERLQAGALALARAQRRLGVHLPGPLVGRILSLVLP